MRRSTKSLLALATASVLGLGSGCASSETDPTYTSSSDSYTPRRQTYTPPPTPSNVAKDIPLYGNPAPQSPQSPGAAGAEQDGPPPIDTTGVRLGELPSVRAATT